MHEDEDGQMVLTKDVDGAGTVTHQAPELLRESDKAGTSVDMFALGIMVSNLGFAGGREHQLQRHGRFRVIRAGAQPPATRTSTASSVE